MLNPGVTLDASNQTNPGRKVLGLMYVYHGLSQHELSDRKQYFFTEVKLDDG